MSIIIPTYNRAELVADAVESVLGQGVLVPEVVVVDDGSTDGTDRVLARFGTAIRSIRQDNGGPAAARNTGIRHARGELIGFLDSDNLCAAGSLDRRVGVLFADPSIDLVIGYRQYVVRQRDARTGSVSWVPVGEPVAARSLSSTVVRRRALDRIGVLDEALRFGEDDDWFMRADELAMRIVIEPSVCQLSRRHDSNLTHDRDARLQALLRILKSRRDRALSGGGYDITRSAASGAGSDERAGGSGEHSHDMIQLGVGEPGEDRE